MSARERLGLYPAIEPYHAGRLEVAGGHEISFVECGIVPDSGHAMSEPGIIHELVSATRRFARAASAL